MLKSPRGSIYSILGSCLLHPWARVTSTTKGKDVLLLLRGNNGVYFYLLIINVSYIMYTVFNLILRVESIEAHSKLSISYRCGIGVRSLYMSDVMPT